ncbi:MAG: DUF5615 family PIN-like protein, partial [Dehalococcoidia bacterium]
MDECTGPNVARWLAETGHDVYFLRSDERGLADDEILLRAVEADRVLITNDKDFGEMIFRQRQRHRGVILLRLSDERSANKIRVLETLL